MPKYKGLSVIVRSEQEFNKLKEFLGDQMLYSYWSDHMIENETGVVILSRKRDVSAGSVGLVERQANLYGFRCVEFSEFFKL